VFIIVDVRAPFREAGKRETALDKAGLPQRRLFVGLGTLARKLQSNQSGLRSGSLHHRFPKVFSSR